jgi:hypothetical protein
MHVRAVVYSKTVSMHFSVLSGKVGLISDLAGASCHNVTLTQSCVLRRPYIRTHVAFCASLHNPLQPFSLFTPEDFLVKCLTTTMPKLEIFALIQVSRALSVVLGISLEHLEQSHYPGTDTLGQVMHRVPEMLLGFPHLNHPNTLQPKPLRRLVGNQLLFSDRLQLFIQLRQLCLTQTST